MSHDGGGGHTAGARVVADVDDRLEAPVLAGHPVLPVLGLRALARRWAGHQGPEVELLVIDRRRPRPLNVRQPPPPPPLHRGRGGRRGDRGHEVPGDDDVDVSVTLAEIVPRLLHAHPPETCAIHIHQLVTKLEAAVSGRRSGLMSSFL